jgi:hypothetical protein
MFKEVGIISGYPFVVLVKQAASQTLQSTRAQLSTRHAYVPSHPLYQSHLSTIAIFTTTSFLAALAAKEQPTI